ncbi:MAG: CmcJ/NvfI family oxidoreductase [Sphingomonas sp.]
MPACPSTATAGEAEKHAYQASVAAYLKELSGADLVVPQGKGLLIRHAESAGRKGTPGPSRWVHMDYTPDAARKWSEWMVDWEAIRGDLYSRFVIFQTWRCLTPPPCDNTLVLCDASSIDAADCIPFDACVALPYDEPGNQFESQLGKHNAGQRWYYFSALEADEMIVFKGFDSAPGWSAQPMHHSIDLPGEGAPRTSVEARFFAYFA